MAGEYLPVIERRGDVKVEQRFEDAVLLAWKMEELTRATRRKNTPPEAGTGQETDSLLLPSEESRPCPDLSFISGKLISDF